MTTVALWVVVSLFVGTVGFGAFWFGTLILDAMDDDGR